MNLSQSNRARYTRAMRGESNKANLLYQPVEPRRARRQYVKTEKARWSDLSEMPLSWSAASIVIRAEQDEHCPPAIRESEALRKLGGFLDRVCSQRDRHLQADSDIPDYSGWEQLLNQWARHLASVNEVVAAFTIGELDEVSGALQWLEENQKTLVIREEA
jgi:hypothetical protein